jgi:hypothetical protein
MGRRKSDDLPPRMIARRKASGNTYYYYSLGSSQRKEIPLGKNLHDALKKYQTISVQDTSPKSRVPVPENFHIKLYRQVVKNSKPRKIAVKISADDVKKMLSRAKGKCELTKVAFNMQKIPGQRIRPWIPSVDRIDSKLDYSFDNCRIICAAANIALNQFGEYIFVKMASSMIRNHGRSKF